MFEVRVDSAKIHRLEDRLGGATGGSIFEVELRHALEDTLLDMEAVARRRAKPHTVDTGTTARAIESRIYRGGRGLEGKLFTRQIAARAIEFGRRPGGKMPPSAPIADWVRRHRLPPTAVFLIRRKIARRGTTGLFFMRAAAEQAQQSIKKYADRAFLAIQASWGRP